MPDSLYFFKKITMFVFLLVFPFSACKFLSMQYLEITGTLPATNIVDVASLTKIEVFFSTAVNKGLAENAFYLLEDGSAMDGQFEWPGSDHLVFKPFSKLKATAVYTIKITTEAEDSDGNSLESDFIKTFQSSDRTVRPIVESVTPVDKALISGIHPDISINFSAAMNISSVIKAFSISPDVDGYLMESTDGKRFKFILTTDLKWQTSYTITIADTAMDTEGRTIGKNSEFSFFTGTDSLEPAILSTQDADSGISLTENDAGSQTEIITSNLEKTAKLTINFSKSMNQTSVKNSLSFIPATTFSLNWNSTGNQVTITPDSLYKYGTLYTFTIDKSCEDLQGNTLTSVKTYKFNVDGQKSKPPAITVINFLNKFSSTDGITAVIPLSHLDNIAYSDTYNTTATIGFFDIYLSLADTADLNMVDFTNSFSIAATNASITPVACQIDAGITFMTDTVPVTALGSNTHIVRYIVSIDNSSATYKWIPGYILLSLDASFPDTLGNTLGEKWAMRVNTTN